MKAKELMEKLYLSASDSEMTETCDKLITGNPDTEVKNSEMKARKCWQYRTCF